MVYTPYEILKWWLPIISAFGLIIKTYLNVKASIAGFAERLLNNHLAGIETATVSTEKLTRQTNTLLEDNTGKLNMLQNTVASHQEKEMQVWQGVLNTLSILEDRTRRAGSARKAAHAKR